VHFPSSRDILKINKKEPIHGGEQIFRMLQVPIQQKRMRQMSKRRLVLPAESADEGARGGTDREFNRVRVRERGETFGFLKKKSMD
jgi:hypothetical protein